MRIMVMADTESPAIWDHYTPGKLADIDLVLACGDLSPHYLSFIETFTNVPVLYVHGNHDEKYAITPPDGCFSIEDDIYVQNGVRILGLGGSMRYRPGTHQYTERDMQKRVRKLWWKLKRYGGFDILVTHAPAMGLHDGDDLCHKGFATFRTLLEQYQPKYYVHGHVHMNYGLAAPRLSLFQQTVVINAYRTFTFEYEDPALREQAGKAPH